MKGLLERRTIAAREDKLFSNKGIVRLLTKEGWL